MLSTDNNYKCDDTYTNVDKNVKSESIVLTVKSDTQISNRPSSPRQFFERIYGHLESSNTSNEQNDTVMSPDLSEISSSPEIIDIR